MAKKRRFAKYPKSNFVRQTGGEWKPMLKLIMWKRMMTSWAVDYTISLIIKFLEIIYIKISVNHCNLICYRVMKSYCVYISNVIDASFTVSKEVTIN